MGLVQCQMLVIPSQSWFVQAQSIRIEIPSQVDLFLHVSRNESCSLVRIARIPTAPTVEEGIAEARSAKQNEFMIHLFYRFGPDPLT